MVFMAYRLQHFVALIALSNLCTYAYSMEQDVASCAAGDVGSCVAAGSRSLLQKVFQLDGKSVLDVAPDQPEPVKIVYNNSCNGTQADGKCWFLSDLGQSCVSTCEKNGRPFSYAVPTKELIPTLVHHDPAKRDEPWVALECFSPSDDRFHPVNPNAAKHFEEGVGDWTHENCKLACPCGRPEAHICSWKPPVGCAPEFVWKGVKYAGCASQDMERDTPWCQHNFQTLEEDHDLFSKDWSYCIHTCIREEREAPKEADGCEWRLADGCVHEFDIEDVHITGCTGAEGENKWCSTSDPYKDSSRKACTKVCPTEVPKTVPVPVPVPDRPKEDAACGWVPAASCVKEFDYEDTHYIGCTLTDHATPWCSNTDPYKGSWNDCVYTCSRPAVIKAPTAAPQEPVVPEKNATCGWVPADSCVKEFDYEDTHYVGCTLTDHATPWCSNTNPYTGSWNNCSYICSKAAASKPVTPERETTCTWQPNAGCATTFAYKGIDYTGCITEDHPTPWCSLDRVHAGAWETCSKVCSSVIVPAVPVPQPETPVEPPAAQNMPCDRIETEDDSVGNSVALDAVGYEISATTGTSSDVKRFVCRIVSSMACKVTDLSALMDFVARYGQPEMRVTAQQTTESYRALTAELLANCRTDGKWIVPQPHA